MSDLTPAPNGYPIKLVRDKTADVINSTGEPGQLYYGPLPPGEDPGKWLRRKLVEEVAEYVEGHGVSELCDVLAVVVALGRRCHGAAVADLLEVVAAHPRGGFDGTTMMYGKHPEFDDVPR